EDGVRSVIFSPGQLQDVIRETPGRGAKPISFSGPSPRTIGNPLPTPWTIESVDPWDRWTRTIRLDTVKGRFDIPQRLTFLSPERARVDALKVDLVSYYKTRELGSQTVRLLLAQYFKDVAQSPEPEADRRLLTAKFLIQAGY